MTYTPEHGHLDKKHFDADSQAPFSFGVLLDLHTERERLNEEQAMLVDRTIMFCTELSTSFQKSLHKMLAKHHRRTGVQDSDLSTYINQHVLDRPVFDIYIGHTALDFLESVHLSKSWKEPRDSALLVFRFPKVLNQFWRKGSIKQEHRTYGHVVPWGIFYGNLRALVMGKLRPLADQHDIQLTRVNSYGDHNDTTHYYIWRERDKDGLA